MLHSLIGKNDGVSIVIDQLVNAMIHNMDVPLGNIYFLAAHISPRFNADTDEILWHKNDVHRRIIESFNSNPPDDLDEIIHTSALYASGIIRKAVARHDIDVIIAHNVSHPYNFITAVGLGYYLEECRRHGEYWPKVIAWWHDSYFERSRFENPNAVIRKYLQYLPGLYIDGIVFINSCQPKLARKVYRQYGMENLEQFFKTRTAVIPNTSEIPWDWQDADWHNDAYVSPEQDSYNRLFFKDIGVCSQINKLGYAFEDAVILLQHTRVVPRKRIELAIDFAFEIEKKFHNDKKKKCVVLLISGPSGDEQAPYKQFLRGYFKKKLNAHPRNNILMIFGERNILPHRDIIVDTKYFRFSEIPSIVASAGGLGTYFSEEEGFGNNLLEMVRWGLPAVINEYEVYRRDIKKLGFNFPHIRNNALTPELVDAGYSLLTDFPVRNELVKHNLSVLDKKLPHSLIAKKLEPMLERILKG